MALPQELKLPPDLLHLGLSQDVTLTPDSRPLGLSQDVTLTPDSRPLGLSQDVTLAVLPRLYMEEVVSELGRRNISTGDVHNKELLVAVLRVVLEKEYSRAGTLYDKAPLVISMPTQGKEISATLCGQTRVDVSGLSVASGTESGKAISKSQKSANTAHPHVPNRQPLEQQTTPTTTPVLKPQWITLSPTQMEQSTMAEVGNFVSIDGGSWSSSESEDLDMVQKPQMKVKGQTKKDGSKQLKKCPHCEYTSLKSSNFRKHVLRHSNKNNEKPFKCSHCDYAARTRHLLCSHTRIHTGEKPFTCKTCDFKTAHPEALKKHMKTHTGEKPYMCDVCGHRTALANCLRRHMATVHSKEPLKCHICGYVAIKASNLESHMKTHSTESSYRCDFEGCSFTATIQRNLQKHQQKVHVKEKPFACDQCAYKTHNKYCLTKHMKTHTGEKPFACDQCDYTSVSLSGLSKHKRKHTGEKLWPCDVCGRKCFSEALLEKHKEQHSGKKGLLVCKECNYRTFESQAMKEHKRVHTGERPYACDQCEYRAALRVTLKKHMRTHSSEKPFKCPHCDYCAKRKDVLKSHFNYKHKGEIIS